MKKILIWCFFLSFSGILNAQNYLRIGDAISTKNNILKRYKGKAVLIDFWGVYCKSCIEAFPKLENLQKKFNSKLQILLVTKNSSEQVEKLKAKSSIVRNVNLPMIVNDTLLSKLFYFQSEPTNIWIDSTGVIRHITEGWHVSESNIQSFVDGKKFSLPVKDEMSAVEKSSGEQKELDSANKVLFYSCLTDYMPGQAAIISKIYDKPVQNVIGIKASNCSLFTLYMAAFPFIEQTRSRVILNVKNPGAFILPKDSSLWDSFFKNYNFCYELKVPLSKAPGLYDYMRDDLQRYFGYSASVETRKVRCLVINEKKEARSHLNTKGGAYVFNQENDQTKFTLRNVKLSTFFNLIKQYNYNISEIISPPIVIDVKYKGNVDLDINCALTDIPNLKKELFKYGLILREEEREEKMLVIRD